MIRQTRENNLDEIVCIVLVQLRRRVKTAGLTILTRQRINQRDGLKDALMLDGLVEGCETGRGGLVEMEKFEGRPSAGGQSASPVSGARVAALA